MAARVRHSVALMQIWPVSAGYCSGARARARNKAAADGHRPHRVATPGRLHGTVGIGADGHPAMINPAYELLT